MTETIYKLWFKIQLNTRAGARNPKTESCHDNDPAVTHGVPSADNAGLMRTLGFEWR